MSDIDGPVTTPNAERASEAHPVMSNVRNDARTAYRKKYGKSAPKGWPYTEGEVRLANKLLDLHEANEDGSDVDDDQFEPMKRQAALDRLK